MFKKPFLLMFIILFLHLRSFRIILIFLFSLYLSSLSIIENVLISKFNFLTQYDAITEEFTPPLKQTVIGTSDLVRNPIDF